MEFILDIEDGIKTFAANPESRRLMAIVTNRGALVLVTIPDGQVLTEADLWTDESSSHDKHVEIVWRHDSLYFAVNFVNDAGLYFNKCIR